MKTKYVFIGVGALIALTLLWKRKEKLTSKENPDFREGYIAGVFTPGPFSILALAGLASHSF